MISPRFRVGELVAWCSRPTQVWEVVKVESRGILGFSYTIASLDGLPSRLSSESFLRPVHPLILLAREADD